MAMASGNYRACEIDAEDIMEDDGVHDLLREPHYNFSAVTRQRALIAWIGTGRKNDFNAVCKYYHFLEQHENTLPREARIISRSLEFSALPTSSPQAEILQQVFPNLYTEQQSDRVESTADGANCRGVPSTETIIPASIAITNYLKSNGKDMATFLNEFKHYTNARGLSSTLNTLLHYIQDRSGQRSSAAAELDESFDGVLCSSLSGLFIHEDDEDALRAANKEGRSASQGRGPKGKKSTKHKYNEEEKENYDTKQNYADVARKPNMNHANVARENNDEYAHAAQLVSE